MRSPFTTRISSRGPIVVPGPIRKAHALEAGTSFLVLAQDDTIVLHRLQEPPWQLLKKSIVECLKGRSFSCAVASLLFLSSRGGLQADEGSASREVFISRHYRPLKKSIVECFEGAQLQLRRCKSFVLSSRGGLQRLCRNRRIRISWWNKQSELRPNQPRSGGMK